MNLSQSLVKGMVTEKGFRVYMDTYYCKFWLNNHKDCAGCESERGCKKVSNIIDIARVGSMASQGTPEEVQNNINWCRREIEKELKDEEDKEEKL